MRPYVVGAVLALSLTGISACGSADDASKDPAGGNPSTSSPASPTTVATPTAAPASTPKTDGASVAAKIKKSVPSVSKVVRITEDNDPNDKIGRPGGYVDGAVLYDKAASCTELGADCGATIEIWGSPEDAKSRAAYIARTYKDAPALGSEYLYLNGTTLLRVDDQLKPSTASAYAKAIGGLAYKT